jgi:poly-gamma-glutamate synthase PgsB/CapB
MSVGVGGPLAQIRGVDIAAEGAYSRGMFAEVDFGLWVAGWTALAFTIIYGAFITYLGFQTRRLRKKIHYRILVTGSRGKSGTVRLIHAALSPSHPTYAKITGTAAQELYVDGSEVPTTRLGATSVSEMPIAVRRAARQGARYGVFECMAVSPPLIRTVQHAHVQAQMVVIPTIRLDHLEEEGLHLGAIAESIISAISGCDVVVTAVSQDVVLAVIEQYCREEGIELVVVHPDEQTPEILGHHPVNVALALAVAERLGVSRSDAQNGLESVSLEPRALEVYRAETTDGASVFLFDLGGANDPESAVEAFTDLRLPLDEVVPIMVNRWERPLRSVTFFASLRGAFPVVGVMGPLARWVSSRHDKKGFPGNHEHNRTEFFKVTKSMVTNLDALVEAIRHTRDFPNGRIFIVLLENIHDPLADRLRATFEREGEQVPAAQVRTTA